MIQFLDSKTRRFLPRLVLSGLTILVAVRPQPTQADVMNTLKHDASSASSEMTALEAFLAGGPTVWMSTKHPRIPAGLKLTHSDGELKNNDLLAYITWKRDKDPALFDKEHPKIAEILQHGLAATMAHDQAVSSAPGVPTASSVAGTATSVASTATNVTTSSASSPSTASNVAPVAEAQFVIAPEPSGMALALVILGSAAWWRPRRAA